MGKKMDFHQLMKSKQYTPDWFAERYPGFYSPECYDILANYFNRQERFRKFNTT